MEGLLLVVVLGATVLVGTTIGQRYRRGHSFRPGADRLAE
jgi:hypothetical protein